MRQSPPATLFDVAGLAEQATSADVAARWEQVVKAAGGKLASIDTAVRNAFLVLSAPQNLELYRDLLRSCREETNIPVRAAEVDTFVRFCAMCLITPFQHPQQRELFAVCLAGQNVPRWVRYDPETMSHLRLRWGQRLEYWIQHFLLGGVFRDRTGSQRAGITLIYLMALIAVGIGGRSLILVVAPVVSGQTVRPGPSSQSAPVNPPASRPAVDFGAIAATCERVRTNLRHIDEQAAVVAREFEQVAGAKLADAAADRTSRPQIVDAAIAKDSRLRETWYAILDDRVEPSDINERKSTVEAIQNRASNKGSRDSDDAEARQLEIWTKNMLERLRGQRKDIDHLRVMLNADRFDKALDQPDGSKP